MYFIFQALIEYKQWESNDRTTLETHTLPLEKFYDVLIASIEKLTSHSFFSKVQSSYCKELKNNLEENTAIILVDFAENYSFVVQDAVQGFHWNNSQATLHPVVIYYKQNGKHFYMIFCICNWVKHYLEQIN